MRRIIQSILAVPAVALVMCWPWFPSTEIAYFVVSSVLGIFGLFYSIIVSPRSEIGIWRWVIASGLIVGLQLYVYLLQSWSHQFYTLRQYLFAAWLLGGPLTVAVWNLVLLLTRRERPNQALEPTPTSVTSAAEQPPRRP